MPKGNLLKQNLLKGIISVVNRLESSDNGICQNPLFVLSLFNTVAPASLPGVSSTDGMACTSLKTLSFSDLDLHKSLLHQTSSALPPYQRTREWVCPPWISRPWTPFAPAPLVLCRKEVVEAHFEECTMTMEWHRP